MQASWLLMRRCQLCVWLPWRGCRCWWTISTHSQCSRWGLVWAAPFRAWCQRAYQLSACCLGGGSAVAQVLADASTGRVASTTRLHLHPVCQLQQMPPPCQPQDKPCQSGLSSAMAGLCLAACPPLSLLSQPTCVAAAALSFYPASFAAARTAAAGPSDVGLLATC